MSASTQDKSLGIRLNRGLLGFARNWLKVVTLILFLYVGLPIAAPILMHFGATGPARVIYTMYSPLCHQFAFRSWFLFGAQPAYPRAEANFPSLLPYETFRSNVITASDLPVGAPIPNLSVWGADLITLSRAFIGDAQMGYKMALCERDIAIYGALFIGALLYSIPGVRGRLRPVPFWLYVLLGLGPIGLDGFSQLLSEAPFSLWTERETTPLFRVLTGTLFGLMNAWLALPYFEESMRQLASDMTAKFARRAARNVSQLTA